MAAACVSRGQELADRGDDLLYRQRFDEAARQFELVLHECGDKTDDSTNTLRINTLKKLASLKQYYLNDAEGALRINRLIIELSPNDEAGFEASRNVIKLMRSLASEPTAVIAEIERLMAKFPARANIPRLNLALAEIAFRSGRYKDVEQKTRLVLTAKDVNIRVEAAMMLASAQEMQDEVPAALKTYESLEKDSMLNAEIRSQIKMSVAHCYERLGQLDRARTLYKEMAKSAPDPDFIRARITRLDDRLQEGKKRTTTGKRRRKIKTRSSTKSSSR